MTVNEMIRKKKEAGYSCEQISELSGVPLSTVRKVFGGITGTPRHSTIEALAKAFEVLSPSSGTVSGSVYASGDSHTCGMAGESRVSYGYSSGSSALDLSGRSGKTLEDYLALPDDVRVEMIDGVFYDMASPTSIHQIISASIYRILYDFIKSKGGACIPLISPIDVRLDRDDRTIVQPDVIVVCDRSRITKPGIEGAPDLVIEVVSPSNWYHDLIRKHNKYKKAGVREYWLVFPDSKSIQVCSFDNNSESTEYTFEDCVPVGIWNGECTVDFKEIYEDVSFLY